MQRAATWLAGLEALCAVFGVTILAIVLTAGLVPRRTVHDVALLRDPDFAGTRLDAAELASAVEREGLAAAVDVVERGGLATLALSDVAGGADWQQRLDAQLVAAGYRPRASAEREELDLTAMIRSGDWRLPAVLTIEKGLFLAAALLLLARGRVEPMPLAGSRGRAAAIGVVAGAAALAVAFVVEQALAALGMPVEEQAWVLEILERPDLLVQLAPWLVLIGPLGEEWFFRGYVQRRMREAAGPPAALLVSSLLFAFIHFNVSGFLIYLVIGVALGIAHEWTGRLLAPVIGHVVVNGWQVAIALASPSS